MAEQTGELPCQNNIQVIKTSDDQGAGNENINTTRPVLLMPTNDGETDKNNLVPPKQVIL